MDRAGKSETSLAGVALLIIALAGAVFMAAFINTSLPSDPPPPQGRIEGIRAYGEDGVLPGATIGLFYPGEEIFPPDAPVAVFARSQIDLSKETAVQIAVSNYIGSFVFTDLSPGIYIIHELYAPYGHIPVEDLYIVRIDQSGLATEITIGDRPKPIFSIDEVSRC